MSSLSWLQLIRINLLYFDKTNTRRLAVTTSISLSRQEYYDAITTAITTASTMGPEKSNGEISFCKILAWVWDSTLINAKLEDFQVLDSQLLDTALKLLIGRLECGRPVDHKKRDELEKFYYSISAALS